jgi:hypothetical protein
MPPNRSNSVNPLLRSSQSLVLKLVVSLGASCFLGWFLSFPVLEAYKDEAGQAISRLQFLTRLLLPELWWSEITAGGKLPLGIIDRLPVLLGAGGWLGVAYFVGRPLVDRVFARRHVMRIEHWGLATLAGLALLSTSTLMVGLCGGSSSRWPILGTVAILLIVAWRTRIPLPVSDRSFCQVAWLSDGIVPRGVFGQLAGRWIIPLTVVLGVIYLFAVVMPPYEFDVVEYHLQSAKEFFQQGYIGFSPHNIYMNMPLGVEMHGLAAMSLVNGEDGWWLGGLIGKTIVGCHAFLAAAIIGGFCARRGGAWVGWCAAGIWLAVPGNAHVSFAGLVDTALSTYILAGVVTMTHLWRRCAGFSVDDVVAGASGSASGGLESPSSPAGAEQHRWTVLLAAVYTGAAAAVKYPGLVFAVFPCVLWASWIFSKYILRPSWRQASVWLTFGLLGGLVTCVPWYAKNVVLAGNPVYPLAYSLFGGRDFDNERAEQWAVAHRVPGDSLGSNPYSLPAAIESTMHVLIKSEFMQPVLPILVLCALAGWWSERRKRSAEVIEQGVSKPGRMEDWSEHSWVLIWLGLSLWMLSVWWFATHRIDRFWLPAVSLWSVLAGMGVEWTARKISHWLATILVLVGLVYGIIISASPVLGDNRYLVALDALRLDSGDGEVVGRISRVTDWCNQNLSRSDSRLLLVGEAKAFDFRMPIIYSTCFNDSQAEKWLRGLSAEEQRENLRSQQVTHLLVNWSEIARYRAPGNYGFSDWPQRQDMDELVRAGVLRRVGQELDSAIAEVFEVRQESNAP